MRAAGNNEGFKPAHDGPKLLDSAGCMRGSRFKSAWRHNVGLRSSQAFPFLVQHCSYLAVASSKADGEEANSLIFSASS